MEKLVCDVFIISTGTELATGKTIDANGPFIASTLTDYGFTIKNMHILPDDPDSLFHWIQGIVDTSENSLIFITGGLGPTMDDHTIDILSRVSGLETIFDETSLRKINILIKKRKIKASIDIIKRQARVLSGAGILNNKTGLAPGLIFKIKTNKIIALPGVPEEMQGMFENEVLPKIIPKNNNVFIEYYYLYNISETAFQSKFLNPDLPDSLRYSLNKVKWGVTSLKGKIKVFVSTDSADDLQIIQTHILDSFEDILINQDAVMQLHNLAVKNKITISLAESCTGGLVGKLLTDTPGSSAYFKGSMVTYANDAKVKILALKKDIIEKYGAVSEECSNSMAKGVLEKLESDFSLSITGIAGPEGGNRAKPVGSIYLTLYSKNHIHESRKLYIPLNRARIREHAANIAIFYLFKFIQKLL